MRQQAATVATATAAFSASAFALGALGQLEIVQMG